MRVIFGAVAVAPVLVYSAAFNEEAGLRKLAENQQCIPFPRVEACGGSLERQNWDKMKSSYWGTYGKSGDVIDLADTSFGVGRRYAETQPPALNVKDCDSKWQGLSLYAKLKFDLYDHPKFPPGEAFYNGRWTPSETRIQRRDLFKTGADEYNNDAGVQITWDPEFWHIEFQYRKEDAELVILRQIVKIPHGNTSIEWGKDDEWLFVVDGETTQQKSVWPEGKGFGRAIGSPNVPPYHSVPADFVWGKVPKVRIFKNGKESDYCNFEGSTCASKTDHYHLVTRDGRCSGHRTEIRDGRSRCPINVADEKSYDYPGFVTVNGPVIMGENWHGSVKDVRLWDKVISWDQAARFVTENSVMKCEASTKASLCDEDNWPHQRHVTSERKPAGVRSMDGCGDCKVKVCHDRNDGRRGCGNDDDFLTGTYEGRCDKYCEDRGLSCIASYAPVDPGWWCKADQTEGNLGCDFEHPVREFVYRAFGPSAPRGISQSSAICECGPLGASERPRWSALGECQSKTTCGTN